MREVSQDEWLALRDEFRRSCAESAQLRLAAQTLRSAVVEGRILRDHATSSAAPRRASASKRRMAVRPTAIQHAPTSASAASNGRT